MKTKKYPIVKKAWSLVLDKIKEGYLWSPRSVYAETRNQARLLMMKEIEYEDMRIADYEEEDLSYINIPIARNKDLDLVSFEGKNLTAHEIELLLKERKRILDIDEILKNKSVAHVYIIKRCSFYAKNWSGYSEHKFYAGVYEKKAAANHAKSCSELTIEPCDIKEHNDLVENEKNRLHGIFEERKKYLEGFLFNQ